MTESEAIKKHIDECNNRIENISFFIDSNSDANKEECCNNIEILQNVINALEKQIPKKPDCIEDKMWCCPVCDNNLLHKWIKYPTRLMPKSEGLPHCMSCGQAIDWSDEE